MNGRIVGTCRIVHYVMGVRFSEVSVGFHCISAEELINSNANCLEIASLFGCKNGYINE